MIRSKLEEAYILIAQINNTLTDGVVKSENT